MSGYAGSLVGLSPRFIIYFIDYLALAKLSFQSFAGGMSLKGFWSK
jgi:hypothetical protein